MPWLNLSLNVNFVLRPTTSVAGYSLSSLPLSPSGFVGAAETTFNLPLSSNVLFLTFTNVGGPTMSGSVDVVTSPNQPHDIATVRVVSYYMREDIYKDCKVRMVRRAAGENGVDVCAPDWVRQERHPDDGVKIFFEMTVTLPELSSPLVIKRFETDLRNTVLKVHDLKDKVLFQSLSLKGTNGDVHVASLNTNKGRIETSNGSIYGHIDTSGELNLSTTNGRIRVDVGLKSTGGSTPKVSIGSTNGAIESNINLFSSSGSGGSFEASAITTNGRMNIKFPTAPVDSKLTFVGESKSGEATVSLNPAYDGTFKLQAAMSIPKVDNHTLRDPSGRNRKRIMLARAELSRPSRKVVTGQVYWEDAVGQAKATRGTVDIQTKNGKLILTL